MTDPTDVELRPRVAVLDTYPATSRAVIDAAFSRDFEIWFADGDADSKRSQVRNAQVLLAGWEAVTADLIEAAKGCRLIQKLGAGVDKIDLAAAERCHIPVLRAAGINATAVAEMTVLLTLAVLRRLVWAAQSVRAGRLAKEQLRTVTYQLAGKTVGLLGAGYVGRSAAKRFAAFEVRLTYYDVRRLAAEAERDLQLSFLPIDQLVSSADILSLHLPLTDETEGIVSRALLARMKPTAILVNTARGGLVDEEALTEALLRKSLAGAGLDVTVQEPIPTTSPLLSMDNVVITPHYAGSVADNFPRVVAHAYRNAVDVLAGRLVSPEDVVHWPA